MRPKPMEAPRRCAIQAALVLLLAACGGGSGGIDGGEVPPPEVTPAPGGPSPVPTSPPGNTQARLDRVVDCEALVDALRGDAAAKIGGQAARMRESGGRFYESGGAPPPSAPVPSVDSDGAGDFTETNVQVEGVDEADVIETDGQRIYVLHGSAFVVVDAWPPTAAALESMTPIEGVPEGMFVAGDRAVVFSRIYDETDRFGDLGDCSSIGPPVLPIEPEIAGDIAPCRPALTKVTVLDLSAAPSVVREVYTEGSYTAARRHDAVVRVVVQGDGGLPRGVPEFWLDRYGSAPVASEEEFRARVDAWEQEALAAIEESELSEWLPGQWEVEDGVLAEVRPLCSDVHLPPSGQTDQGMTRILGLDMNENEGELHDALIVGRASSVYANLDRLVLAQPDWAPSEEGDRTAVHVFGVGASTMDSSYLGSGYVPGVPHGQFSFDMQGDVLRVATTQWGPAPDRGSFRTTSRIVTTGIMEGALQILGSTGDLAPGERIFSVRYVGDRGYLVTFRQVDPLFVVDLSDPSAPTVLGELKIPGFSEYMHPLGDDHLLTIGQDADEQGRVRGLALRIFDVSDDANPVAAHLYRFGEPGSSAASDDHRAFLFDEDRGLLSFPYVSYEGPYRSVLELFAVDAIDGFTRVGAVDHTDLGRNPCGESDAGNCRQVPWVRRGLFLDDFLYSIGATGVLVHRVRDLTDPVATVLLPGSMDGGGPD